MPQYQPGLGYICHVVGTERTGLDGRSAWVSHVKPRHTWTDRLTVPSLFAKRQMHDSDLLDIATATASTAASMHAHLAHFLKRRHRIHSVYLAEGAAPHS